MKKFSRIVVFVLALAMILSISSCSSKKVGLKILDTEYTTEDYAIAIAQENTDLLDKVDTALNGLIADGTVQKIIDKYINGTSNDLTFQQNAEGKEELSMGTNAEFPPYEYYDGDNIVGIDAEVAAAIADQLDMKLVIKDMAFDSIIVSVQQGKVDMGMAGMTVTDERKQSVNFTTSYATGVQVVIVRDDSEITSVDDLFADGANYNIGVQTATTGDLYATWDLEDEGLATIQRYNKGADAVAALVAGKIDCVIIDNEPAKAFVAANNG
ncbi:MAG: transporter substrate-binding domain-containing protein [Oscillospiraceae bacterium]